MGIKWEKEGDEVKSGDLVKWDEVGKSIEGILIGHDVTSTPNGDAERYEFLTSEGVVATFAPSILHQKLKNLPKDGSFIVYAEFTDTSESKKGNDLKHFKVFHLPTTEENKKKAGIDTSAFAGLQDDEDLLDVADDE